MAVEIAKASMSRFCCIEICQCYEDVIPKCPEARGSFDRIITAGIEWMASQ